jgi:cyanophycinase
MEPVDRALLARLGGPARVVCLPTAAGNEGEGRIGYWSRLGVEHFARLGAEAEAVRVIDRRSAEDASLAARIRAANFVYLSGGKPKYLYQSLAGTATWRAIQDVLDGGGVVAGCSAGAMIFGERIPNWPIPWPMSTGFGLLPRSLVMPHFDEVPEQFVHALKGVAGRRTLIGIDGDTALVATDSTYRVAGRGAVTVWNRAGRRRFADGETVALD